MLGVYLRASIRFNVHGGHCEESACIVKQRWKREEDEMKWKGVL